MTYVPCRGCIEKGREPPCYVPDALQACCDCWLLTPQDRERELDRLRTALERSQRTQRDRFAEAALSAGHSSREAWDSADRMIALRDKSPRERNGAVTHTCAANAYNCFTCGKLLVLNVECPECGASSDENCKTDNNWGLHPERYAAAAQKGSSRS